MQAQIYPTAPADMAQHEAGLPPPSSYSEGEQHVESPGKAKAVLNMVKLKARRFKDKIKKVTNTSSSKDATDHDDLHQPAHEEEEEEAGANLYEDDEEEDDHINQEDNQVKYERLRPFGVLDKQRDGSVSAVAADPATYLKAENEVAPTSPYKSAGPPDALQATPTAYHKYGLNDGSTDPQVEVHGGVPVSAVAADPGTYWRTENEDAPISPYKSDGPPDALQATPIDDRNYDLDDGSTGPHPSLGGLSDDVQVKHSSHVVDPLYAQEKPPSTFDDLTIPSSVGNATIPDHAQVKLPTNTLDNAAYPDALQATPTAYRNYGLNDGSTDPQVEAHGGVPVSAVAADPGTYWRTENEDAHISPYKSDGPPDNEDAHISPYKSDGPPDALQATLTDDRNYDLGDGSTGPHPSLGGLSDDVQVEHCSHVVDPLYAQEKPPSTFDDLTIPSSVGNATIPDYAQVKLPTNTLDNAAYPSEVNDPRGKNLEPDSLSFPTFPEAKTSLLSDSAAADQPCSDRKPCSHGNSASSDMDVGYPEDLVKPNPDFGLHSSPISDKIGVLNEDPSSDNNNTLSGRPLTEECVRDRSKENLLKTAVPEFNELRENQALNTAPVAVEVDELVHRPVSHTTALEADGSSYTAPSAELDGVVYRAEKHTKDNVALKVGGASSDEQADDGVGAVTSVVEDNRVAGSAPGSNLANTSDDYSIVDKSNAIPREEGNNESWGTIEQLNNAKDTISTMKGGLSGENLPSEQSLIERGCSQESLNENWGKWTSDKLNNAENSVTENVGLGGENLSSKQPSSLEEDIGVENEEVEADKSHQEGCGKWSADKLNNAKDHVTTVAGLGDTDVAEQPSINGNAEAQESSTQQWGKWSADKLNNAMDVVATKVGVSGGNTLVEKPADHENVEELAATRRPGKVGNDADEEHYDPNMVKNNAFHEGFSLGNEDAEEEALKANSALEASQDTVASSLSYGNASSGHHPHDESTGSAGASEVGPATDAGCFAETGSKVDSEDMDLPPNQQQTGGSLQDLKNAVAAKLGYGLSEELPADMKAAKEEPKHEAEARIAYVDDERAGKDGDHQPSSYAQKLFNTTAAARDYLAKKVGYGNNENVATSRLVQEEEGDGKPIISSSADVDQLEENDANNINSKPSIASSWLSPAEEDKALSQLITEKMSKTVAGLTQKLVSPRAKPTPTALAPQDDA